jgi:hypothetical protein
MSAAIGPIRAASRRFLVGGAIVAGICAAVASVGAVMIAVILPFDFVTAVMLTVPLALLAIALAYLGTFGAAAVRAGCIEIVLAGGALTVSGCGMRTTMTAADVLAYRRLSEKTVLRLAAPVAPVRCAPYFRAAGTRLSIRTLVLADRSTFEAMLRAFDPDFDKKSKFDLGVLLDSLGFS